MNVFLTGCTSTSTPARIPQSAGCTPEGGYAAGGDNKESGVVGSGGGYEGCLREREEMNDCY